MRKMDFLVLQKQLANTIDTIELIQKNTEKVNVVVLDCVKDLVTSARDFLTRVYNQKEEKEDA